MLCIQEECLSYFQDCIEICSTSSLATRGRGWAQCGLGWTHSPCLFQRFPTAPSYLILSKVCLAPLWPVPLVQQPSISKVGNSWGLPSCVKCHVCETLQFRFFSLEIQHGKHVLRPSDSTPTSDVMLSHFSIHSLHDRGQFTEAK